MVKDSIEIDGSTKSSKRSNPAKPFGQWLIECSWNGYCIGLTWADGVTMNGKPADFYIV